MERELSVSKARDELSTIVDRVQFQGDTYVLSRNGKPAVAVVPLKVYQDWQRQRQAFFEQMQQTAQQTNLSEEEAMKLALEAQEWARSNSE
jgi:prevent-host-death family protein